jgi:hypothetical protein
MKGHVNTHCTGLYKYVIIYFLGTGGAFAPTGILLKDKVTRGDNSHDKKN